MSKEITTESIFCRRIMVGAIEFVESLLLSNLPWVFLVCVDVFGSTFACAFSIFGFWSVSSARK
jgi:hypothetical protein